MLISTLDIISKVNRGGNILAQEQRGTIAVQTIQGDRREPKMIYSHVIGSSLSGVNELAAPIDLFPGDILEVDAGSIAVLRIWRGDGDPAWENADLLEQEQEHEAGAKAKAARRAKEKAARNE